MSRGFRRLMLMVAIAACSTLLLANYLGNEDAVVPTPADSPLAQGGPLEAPQDRLTNRRETAPREPSLVELPVCSILVEDILGGIVEDATVALDGMNIGATDDTGHFIWPDKRTLVYMTVIKDGYVRSASAIACPGVTTVSLSPESALIGHVRAKKTLSPVPDVTIQTAQFEGLSDLTGLFSLRGLPPGTYQISARGRHWYGQLKTPISLDLGEVRTGIDIEVVPAFAVDGVVRNIDESPAKGLKFRCVGVSGETDESGHLTVPGLVPGDYLLELFGNADPSHPSSYYEQVKFSVVDRDVKVEVSLPEQFSLRIDVADSDGVKVPAAKIEVAQLHGQSTTRSQCTTNSDGHCQINGLRKGTVEVKALLANAGLQTISIPEFDRIRIDVDHVPRSLHGRVVDIDGQAIGGRAVVARAIKVEFGGALMESEPGGWFHFDNLAPERYRVEIHRGNSLSSAVEITQDVDLIADNLSDVEVVLSSGRIALRGVVLASNGAPVAQALVTYRSGRRPNSCWEHFSTGDKLAISDESGIFSFAAMPELSDLVLVARDSSGNVGFIASHDLSSPREATITLASTGFAAVDRDVSLRREDCWLRVGKLPDCVLEAVAWPAGATRLTIMDMPVHFGDLDFELQCSISGMIERSVRMTPHAGVDVFFSGG